MGIEVAAGAAILGGVAGAMGDSSGTSSSSTSMSRLAVAAEGPNETAARKTAFDSIGSLDDRLKAIESSPTLARLDSLLQELGNAPTQQRIDQANSTAASAFAPQRVALNQSFEDQTRNYAGRAAQLGRSTADPILAAKLAQEQVRQRATLDANQGAFATNEAINAPGREFNSALAGINGLSQQAIQNRQAVYSLGSDFSNNERQFRLNTAVKIGTNTGESESNSGGGVGGAIKGAIGGAAGGVNIAQSAGMFNNNNSFLSGVPSYNYSPPPTTSYYGGVGGSNAPWNK